jgi:ADP-ribose pyrophosphatase
MKRFCYVTRRDMLIVMGSNRQEEKTVSTVRIHEGRIINLREDTVTLPSGKKAKREIIEHKGAVCIVPISKEGKLIFVRQYRKPAEESLLEIPAGGLEIGEVPIDCAQRELMEECGLRAGSMMPLFECYLAPGYSTELMYGFLGENLTADAAEADEDEDVEVEEYTLDEALQLLDEGKIRDAKTICGLLAYYRKATA